MTSGEAIEINSETTVLIRVKTSGAACSGACGCAASAGAAASGCSAACSGTCGRAAAGGCGAFVNKEPKLSKFEK